MDGGVLHTAPLRLHKGKAHAAAKMESDVGVGATSDSFQMQALEIREPGADFDPNAKPANGEEFLMHMLYERMQCPAVVVRRPKQCTESPNHATVDTAGVQQQMGASDVLGITILPTAEWKLVQAADFQTTRDHIAQLRQELAEQKYDNNLEPPLTADSEDWQQFCRQHKPLLSTVLRLNQRTLEQLLEMLSEWLQCGETVEQEPMQTYLSASTLDLSSSDEWLGTWLYAALACLHLPLEPQVHSTLREIARSCIRLRSRLMTQEIEKAAPYNLFIYLIAQVFGQLDFAEFV